MKKICTVLIAIMVLTMSACGKKEINIDVDELSQKLVDEVDFEDELTQVDDMAVENLYGIDNAVNQMVYVSSGATAEEVAIFEFENADDTKTGKTAALKRIEDQKDSFEFYIPEEVKRLDNAYVTEVGNYVIVCVAEGDDAETIIDEYIK